jgi:acetyl esterase/lipase
MILRPPTGVGFENYCRHTIDDLPPSATLHWVGPRPSEGNILLYFHGGGYKNLLVGQGHMPFAMKCAANGSASLAMLEYTLAPTARYPPQLQ